RVERQSPAGFSLPECFMTRSRTAVRDNGQEHSVAMRAAIARTTFHAHSKTVRGHLRMSANGSLTDALLSATQRKQLIVHPKNRQTTQVWAMAWCLLDEPCRIVCRRTR
ncbi:MAG TPA: hypothetical protein VFG55_07055, partial [Rhodanobacteraceae bacterium]|nr:hypothetical protein [Rhodanobacteraceae bacterium]